MSDGTKTYIEIHANIATLMVKQYKHTHTHTHTEITYLFYEVAVNL